VHGLGNGLLEGWSAGLLNQADYHFGIAGRGELHASLGECAMELEGIDQVAVMGECEPSAAMLANHGLSIGGATAARSRVADMADGDVALELADYLFIKDLRYKALTGMDEHIAIV
jgi:hypothetical protein